MATLHVRNVPDDLYERLRLRAAANARSIGAETVQVLHEQLGHGRLRALPLPGLRQRRSRPGLFTRFTAPARTVVAAAQDQARELGHDHVDTVHLLLGVLRSESPAARALETFGLTFAAALEAAGRGDAAPSGQIPFSPNAKEVLELALREALRLRDNVIAPEHILLGIVRQEGGRGAGIIRAVEPDAERVRRCVLAARGGDPPAPGVEPFRVLELEGSADEWEEQLNSAAGDGYDLVEIVGQRAVFRAPLSA